MLGPFRIRNLRRPGSPSNSRSPGNPSKLGYHDAVVCLTGSEYHKNALRNPESRLKYLDETDGEIVTVGTSMELSQRLQEPVPRYAMSISSSQPRQSQAFVNNLYMPLRPTTPDMHVFEIDRQGESKKIWEEIEQRTQQQRLAKLDTSELRAVTKGHSQNGIPSGHVHLDSMPSDMGRNTSGDHAEDVTGVQTDLLDDVRVPQEMQEQYGLPSQDRHIANLEQLEDARKAHFRASNPPQVSQNDEENGKASSMCCHCSVSSLGDEDTLTKEDTPLLASFHEGNLTTEGKRQAMEAGIQLRARTNPIRHSKSTRELKFVASGKNRWASYGASKPFVVDKPSVQCDLAPDTVHGPKTNDSRGSLLEVFQAELAKISKPSDNRMDEVGKSSTIQGLTQTSEINMLSKSSEKDPESLFGSDVNQLLMNTAKLLTEGLESLVSGLRNQYSEAEERRLTSPSSASASETFEHALRLTLWETDLRIQDATKTCQEVVKCGQALGDKPYKVDIESLRAVLKSFGKATDAISSMASRMSSIGELVAEDGIRHTLPKTPAKVSGIDDQSEWLVKIGPLPDWVTLERVKNELSSLERQDVWSDKSSQIKAIYIPPFGEGEPRTAHCEIIGSRKVVNTLDHFSGRIWGNCRASASMLSPTTSPSQPRGRSRHIINNSFCNSEQAFKPTFVSTDLETPEPSASATNRLSDFDLVHQPIPSNDDAQKQIAHDNVPRPRVNPLENQILSSEVDTFENNFEKRVPSVRFVDPPVVPAKRHVRSQIDPESKVYRSEPTITYRHIPSPMPYEPLGSQRGRQLPKNPPRLSVESSEHRNTDRLPPTETYTMYKRRSMPSLNHGFSSRSRSRSPVAMETLEAFTPKPSLSSFAKSEPLKSTISPRQGNERSATQDTSEWANAEKSENKTVHPVGHPTFPKWSRAPAIQKSPFKMSSNSPVGTRIPMAQATNFSAKYSDLSGLAEISTSVRLENSGPRLRRWRSHHPVMNESIRASHRNQSSFSPHKEHTSPLTHPALKHSYSVGAINKPKITGGLGPSMRPLNPEGPHTISSDSYETGRLPTERPLSSESYKTFGPTPTSEGAESSIAATRFPTLKQFEGRSNVNLPRFPPLPSMEPLTPLRFDSSKCEANSTKIPKSSVAPQQTWPQRERGQEVEESSGDFFKRMTGLDASLKTASVPPSPNPSVNPGALGARLISPFDPLAETAAIHRHQLIDSVHRSNTVAGSSDRWTTRHRRPYSEYFSGNGRVEWESFIKGHQGPKPPISSEKVESNITQFRGLSRTHTTPSRPSRATDNVDESLVPIHHDPSTVSAVQSCVEQLKNLGFGGIKDGGIKRLVVYAQAANGDLGDAIDMIVEERKAYGERG